MFIAHRKSMFLRHHISLAMMKLKNLMKFRIHLLSSIRYLHFLLLKLQD